MPRREWQTLGSVPPGDLADARLQLHWAAQVVATVGKTLLPPQADDSHPNMGWSLSRRCLVGHVVPGAMPFQAALRPADLMLLLLDGEGRVAGHLDLVGKTLDDGFEWMARAIREFAGNPSNHLGNPVNALIRTDYELPRHEVAEGAAFRLEPFQAFREFEFWYAGAQLALDELVASWPAVGSLRVWPHHFDLGAVLPLMGSGRASTDTRSIGVGMTPGDAEIPQPYFYVYPWPRPEEATLSGLVLEGGGRWHSGGWSGAALDGTTLVGDADGATQRQRASAFLRSAVEACRAFLDA